MKDKEIRRMILEELTTGLPSDLVIMEKITESKLAERISNLLKEERRKTIEEIEEMVEKGWEARTILQTLKSKEIGEKYK